MRDLGYLQYIQFGVIYETKEKKNEILDSPKPDLTPILTGHKTPIKFNSASVGTIHLLYLQRLSHF